MGLLSWIIVGLIAGWLAGMVMKTGFGLLGNIIIGVVGGLLGGWLAGVFLGIPDPLSGINLPSILVSFIGAVVLIAIIRLFTGRRITT
ncbi:MAG: GlsB/YeaQ/YmgE family stress response membrane protein [Chloroflexi bacterium HGW-Chloroflexi-10]|jgi:uncharacterized membrane protein YeaQ/YmgE (transglycosylase-associated protein family)|nr:MAG: GlsB/YeaQ/YmgE family stress response membrane protein [Chloroflexi bacterium HGW-Chloroflexi-10]